jgi:N-alpha-acetyltransferase 38, NatC auxiliary subunit
MENNTLAPTTTYLDTLQSFLQQLLRITTIDGRVFLGTFAAVDKPLNIILINAEEYRISQGSGSQKTELNEEGRYVGQVLLPWKMIVKVEIYERHSAREKERRDRGDNIYM